MTKVEWMNQYKTLEYKWYGYDNKDMLLKITDPVHCIWKNIWLPVKVIKEYPRWILVEVKPHINANIENSWGTAKPYRLGINKMSLLLGDYKLKEELY